MALEQLTLQINGKEYTCLKPFPITLIQIEANCTKDDGTLDYSKWVQSMLKLISKSLKVEDLVTYKPTSVKLESGEEITPKEISYTQYQKDYEKLKNGLKDIVGVVKNYVGYCGIPDMDLDTLSYSDIYSIINSYATMYDETELNQAIDKIATFR